MKRGFSKTNTFDERAVIISLNDALKELCAGKYNKFKHYIDRHDIKRLNLSNFTLYFECKPKNLMHLMKAIKNTSIKEINFSRNRLSAESLKVIAKELVKSQITWITMMGCGIDDLACEELANLFENSALTTLNLSGNKIKDDGIKFLSLALSTSKLKELNVEYNFFSVQGMIDLAIGLKDSNVSSLSLSIDYNNIDLKKLKEFFSHLTLTMITSFSIKGGYHIKDDEIKILADYLPDTKITELTIKYTQMSSIGIQALTLCLKNSRVIYLNLEGHFLNAETVKILTPHISQLTSLSLEYNALGDEGVIILTPFLRNIPLEKLNLARNGIGPTGARILALSFRHSHIVSLDLTGNYLGPKGVEFLGAELENSQITKLGLRSNQLGSEGLKKILRYLLDSNITSLEIGNNELGVEDIKRLGNYINQGSLISLSLSHNNRIGSEGIKILANYLIGSLVKKLHIDVTGFNDDSIQFLIDIIPKTSLIQVSYQSEGYGIHCNQALLEALEMTLKLNAKRLLGLQFDHLNKKENDVISGKNLSLTPLLNEVKQAASKPWIIDVNNTTIKLK